MQRPCSLLTAWRTSSVTAPRGRTLTTTLSLPHPCWKCSRRKLREGASLVVAPLRFCRSRLLDLCRSPLWPSTIRSAERAGCKLARRGTMALPRARLPAAGRSGPCLPPGWQWRLQRLVRRPRRQTACLQRRGGLMVHLRLQTPSCRSCVESSLVGTQHQLEEEPATPTPCRVDTAQSPSLPPHASWRTPSLRRFLMVAPPLPVPLRARWCWCETAPQRPTLRLRWPRVTRGGVALRRLSVLASPPKSGGLVHRRPLFLQAHASSSEVKTR